MFSSFTRKIHKRVQRLLPSHRVLVRIAGELYAIDSKCAAEGSLCDYDYAWLRALAHGKRCILDIGANLGYTALMFTRHGAPDNTCVLFDPSAQNLRLAAKNLAYSGLHQHAKLAQCFVGSSGAAVPLFDSAQSASFPPASTVAIDAFCRAHTLQPDLVKIDVEGAEHEVLDGMTETARTFGPAIQVELHTFTMTMEENARRLLSWCIANHYEAWYLSGHVPLTSPAQVAKRGRCHVLLLPAGTPYPDSLSGIPQGSQLH